MQYVRPMEPMQTGNRGRTLPPSMAAALADRRAEMTRRCTEAAKKTGAKILFGMQTSLILQAIPTPAQCDLDDSVMHTVATDRGRRIRGRGFHAHVWKAYEQGAFVRINKYVYALDAAHTWAQISSHVPLEDLIVLADSVIASSGARGMGNGDAPMMHGRLFAVVERSGRFTGIRNCRLALRLCRGGVRSPMESKAYLALMRYGVPAPETNYVVPGAAFRSGVPMTVDLAWPGQKVAVEYDGDQHRTDRSQWRRDQEKREFLRSRGWIVVIVTADDLHDDDARAQLAFRVGRYLAKRGGKFDFMLTPMPLGRLAAQCDPRW